MKLELSFFDKMKIRYNFLKLVKNPYDTERIFHMSRIVISTTDPEYVELVLEEALANPKFVKMWKDRYYPVLPSLEKLSRFPQGSFGHKYYLHMTRLNLNPDLFPAPDFSSVATYFTSRIYQSHDFWHVQTRRWILYRGDIRWGASVRCYWPSHFLSGWIGHL